MKIIDFARKGNVVRFYLGEDDLTDWYGDDWDDYPYECNAGPVYGRFVSDIRDIALPFEWLVLEPCQTYYHSEFSKNEMKARKLPCLLFIPPYMDTWSEDYHHYLGSEGVIKVYLGDDIKKYTDLNF